MHPSPERTGEVIGRVVLLLHGRLAWPIAAHDVPVGLLVAQEGVDGERQPVLEAAEEALMRDALQMGRNLRWDRRRAEDAAHASRLSSSRPIP